MRSFLILALLSLVGLGLGRPRRSPTCPAKYKRFTPQHSFCLAPNPMCQILRTGVSQQDKDLILRLHNQFRSKVAMGNEHRSKGSGMPQAADMMQMEWDDELAAVAQKWTENCKWGHDCNECRAVENFGVGQNLARTKYSCNGFRCQEPDDVPDWTDSITALYDEVVDYHRSWLDSFMEHPGPMTGHFTQLIWSRSWKIGCGYSFYKLGNVYEKYYACNYGPGGNVETQTVYKPGSPCTACPTNTQCSTTGRGVNSFPGLCKMDNPNTAPAYPRNSRGLLFFCGDSNSDGDCRATRTGDGSWKTVRSVGGNYDSIVLNGGQSTTVTYTKPIAPTGDRFCLALNFRKGPMDASNWDESTFEANYKMDRATASPMNLDTGTTSFMDYSINLSWGMRTTVSEIYNPPIDSELGAGPWKLKWRITNR